MPEPDRITPEARDSLLYRAALAHQTGDFVAAERACRELLRLAPGFAPALLLAGMLAVHKGDRAAALSLLAEAAARDPRLAEARTELGMLLREDGRHDEAVARFKEALRINPKDSGAHNNLGLTYLAMGQWPRAAVRFARAIAINPELAALHFNLGLAQRALGRNAEAAQAYRKAAELAPNFAEAHLALGEALLAAGEREAGFAALRRAGTVEPRRASNMTRAAIALVEGGAVADGEALLRQTIALDESFVEAHRALASALTQLGRFDEARASYERTIALDPGHTRAYVGLTWARTVSEADRPLVAAMEAMLARGMANEMDTARLHFALGKSAEDLADYETAMTHFDAANRIAFGVIRERALDRPRLAASIDRIVNGFTPELFARHRDLGAGDERPVLIAGMPRSGTTLVEQILSCHPDIAAGGELAFWGERGPLLGDVARHLDKAALRRLATEYCGLLDTIAPGAPRVTDKRPHNFLMLGHCHLAFPQGRLIHCRRHPVDTCLSIYTTPFQGAPDYAYDKDNLVFYYEQYLRLMAHWRRVLPPEIFMEVDYEELVAEPEAVSRAMIAFCGLEWDARCLAPQANPRVVQTPSAWQARQPVYRRSVERWRRHEGRLGAFARLLGDAK